MKTYRVGATLRPLLCLFVAIPAFVACDGGADGELHEPIAPEAVVQGTSPPASRPVSGDDVPGALDDSAGMTPPADDLASLVPTREAAARALEARLVTAYADAANRESWVCLADSRVAEYVLRVEADGERFGRELDPAGEAPPTPFEWMASGADTLLLDYRRIGVQVEIGSILFGGADAFRAGDSTGGALECRRQRYVDGEPTRDVSNAVPIDVDRDARAARALAERVRTRYAGAVDFDSWHCTCEDGAPLRLLFGAAGVFGPEPRARIYAERETLAQARLYRWAASDGSTLLLVPLDAAAGDADGRVGGLLSIGAIVFPVDGAFAATRGDGVALQCVLQTRES